MTDVNSSNFKRPVSHQRYEYERPGERKAAY